MRASRESLIDQRVSIDISQMGHIDPDLTTWVERVFRDANDHRRFPVAFTGQKAVIRRVDRGHPPNRIAAKDIQPGMKLEGGSKGIAVKIADKAAGRQGERCVRALIESGQLPIAMSIGGLRM